MPIDAARRSDNARIAAYAMHSKHDSRETTAPARRAFMRRFERQVDPEGLLDPADRARRAEAAKSVYFRQLARKSAAVRGGVGADTAGADSAD